jgi:uncharacterized protein YyaL (SSP411 family)
MPNRLRSESSPYLLQHADNPVDWFAWGEEALARARAENKPIFLSIGYSACHWCHVMAHESFENIETAAIMNTHFVNIKVDREERPDLDAIYMAAVVALTGRGGWPMSVFLTPDGRPFYGGTYFPPDDRYGVPAFRRVLLSVARAYREEPDRLREAADRLVSRLDEASALTTGIAAPLAPGVLDTAYDRLAATFDSTNGGFGGAPKFPQPMTLEFLLRFHQRTGLPYALEMVDRTLTAMAGGGIYDHVGGGFHRYATDARWQVPHFEKMLYDNALLARVYLHAWQVTGRPAYRRVVEETLDYVAREMTAPGGGFYAAQDADAEGEEGRYYLWTADEIEAQLGRLDADLFGRYYGVSRGGNFDGRNILTIPLDAAALAAAAGVGEEHLSDVIERGRRALFAARARRVPPGLDYKVLTAWNGLMLAAFAEAGQVLSRADYLDAARHNADFVLSVLCRDGRLLRSWTEAGGARHNAYLEDYACLADGLLALYRATFDVRWFAEARSLADTVLAHFTDAEGGFFDTADDHGPLVVRPKQVQDNATPSGNAMMADVLLRLALLTGDARYRRPIDALLSRLAPLLERYPAGFGHWLGVVAFDLAPPAEVAIVGDPADAATHALLAVVLNSYRPSVVVAFAPDGTATGNIAMLQGRSLRANRPAAYVCRGSVCQAPVTAAADLADMLDGAAIREGQS